MPYIDKKSKTRLRTQLDTIMIDTKDELTYCITMLMMQYCLHRFPITHALLTEAKSTAIDAADEFYRRLIGPYCDQKARELGDTYQEFIRLSGLNTLFK